MEVDNMNTNQNLNQTKAMLVLSLSILVTGALIAASQVIKANWEFQVNKLEANSQVVKNCFEVSKGTRTTSGSTGSEQWQLSQVDLNYEVISKCLGEVDTQ
jgi:hypothetical protein